MNNPARKVFALDDGEGRETVTPSDFQSLGDLVAKIVRNADRMRVRNDNAPVWDAADDALPERKEGS